MSSLNLNVIFLWLSVVVISRVECSKYPKKFSGGKSLKVSNDLTSSINSPFIPAKSKYPKFDEVCSNEPVPPIYGRLSVPTFGVDLELPPEQRWKQVVLNKKKEMNQLLQFFVNNTDRIFGKTVFQVIDKYLPKLMSSLPVEYQKEMKGIAEVAEMELAEVLLFNVFYEFFSLCTSVIMEGADGTMYHGRNLDFTTYMSWDKVNKSWVSSEHLRNLTIQVNFMKNQTVQYSSVNFAGYIGILTAVKKDRFSLTINERFKVNGGYVGLIEWIIGLRKQSWVGFLTRQVLENATNYVEALNMLEKPKLLAPVYFILSGNISKQAAVITRDRRQFDIWNFGSKYVNQKGDWYLVQTNYDHWKPPPRLDDRITPVVKCADKIGNKNSTVTMFQVLSTVPVLNHETIYTAIMEIKSGTLHTWLRHCRWPC